MSNSFWFALPLIVSVSLVYAATRHEEVGAILSHAFRVAVWIAGFMLLVFGILYLVYRCRSRNAKAGSTHACAETYASAIGLICSNTLSDSVPGKG